MVSERSEPEKPGVELGLQRPFHRLLSGQSATDPDLGLKVGRQFDREHGALLDGAAGSAPTVGAAMVTAARAIGLVAKQVRYRVVYGRTRVEVCLHGGYGLARTEADFVASVLRSQQRRTHSLPFTAMEWCFPHPRPACVAEYERTFGPMPFHFSAPLLSFSFDAAYMELPLRTAGGHGHRIATAHHDQASVEINPRKSMVELTHELISRELGSCHLDAKYAARRLHVSPRTLRRQLRREGATFRELLDQARKQQAERYLTGSEHRMGTISSLLGFSEVPSFHRAFRRWMGMTPDEFRKRGLRP